MIGPRILVLGAGGTGGYFGGRLAEASADVTFLVREGRQAALQSAGLRIKSQYGDATIPVRTVTEERLDASYDVVLLTCKAYDLEAAISAIRPAVSSETAILPLLNGIAHIARLNEVFGKHRILGGLAKIQVTLTPDGVVEHFNDWRYLTIGEQESPSSGRTDALVNAFAPAKGVVVEAVSDIMQRMWEKLVHVSTSAAMTCLMRANIGEIVRTKDGQKLLLRLLEANAEIASKSGFPPSAAFMDLYKATFSDPDSTYSTSMLRDIERNAATEGEHILGYMLAQASIAGVSEPILDLANIHLQAYDERRRSLRL